MLGDVEAIGRIHVESWRVAYKGLLPDKMLRELDVAKRVAMWRARIETPRDSDRLWVATILADVIGFAMTTRSRDADAQEREFEIAAIYLAPTHWGAGQGERLFEKATTELVELGATAVSLWVLESNTRARAFYERMRMSSEPAVEKTVRGVAVSEVRYRQQFK